jgi:hypothetical protein
MISQSAQVWMFYSRCAIMAGGPPAVPVKSSSGDVEIIFDRKKRIDRPRSSGYISTVERKYLPMEEVLR